MVFQSNSLIFYRPSNSQGFTLMELLLVILITGIMAVITGAVITRPMQGYVALTQRAALVDQAEMALRRMQRDIRRALPNSIRVSGNAIEMVNMVEGIAYRKGIATGNPAVDDAALDFTTQDTSFNTIGTFSVQPPVVASTGIRLVIYNLPAGAGAGTSVYDAALAPGPFPPAGSHVITPFGTAITIGAAVVNEHAITMAVPPAAGGHQFAMQSPQQRLYIVDTPIAYICDPVVGTLTRYAGYPILPVQPVNPTIAPLLGNDDLVSANLIACGFTYIPGTTQRSGMVRISLTVSDPISNESVTLMHQVHVVNAS